MDDKEKLYNAVMRIIKNGNNAEIRKKPDGSIQVLEVKKHTVTL